jgi:hypothetical protein
MTEGNSIPSRAKKFFPTTKVQDGLWWPARQPVFPEVKLLGREADDLTLHNAEAKNEWSETSSFVCLQCMRTDNIYVYLFAVPFSYKLWFQKTTCVYIGQRIYRNIEIKFKIACSLFKRSIILFFSFKSLFRALCSKLLRNFCDSIAYRLLSHWSPISDVFYLSITSSRIPFTQFLEILQSLVTILVHSFTCNCNLVLLQTALFTALVLICWKCLFWVLLVY